MNDLFSDTVLLNKINSYSTGNEDYWSFKGRSRREHCHGLVQYPAMMVPEMQGELIDAVLDVDKNVKRIFDPFVGSGTTMGEAMCRGLDFFGIDINPLAILSCEVKSGPLYVIKLRKKIESLLDIIKKDDSILVEVNFHGIDKWFTRNSQIELSVIYRAIKKESSKWARKIFWLCMSNTVRSVCNSRSSTFKLHIKTKEQIESIPSALVIFEKNVLSSLDKIEEQRKILIAENALVRSKSKSNIIIQHGDSSFPSKKIIKSDLLISSPPYGDNHTTVTYGQFSYLPLMWIDHNDIQNINNKKVIYNANTIDSLSLGGSKKDSFIKFKEVMGISSSFVEIVNVIEKINPENIKKIISFVFDLDKALSSILNHLRDNAYMIWTLGNRRISDTEIPLDKIMREILESKGCKFVHQINRDIPSKRMARRNRISTTMDKEIILIMRK